LATVIIFHDFSSNLFENMKLRIENKKLSKTFQGFSGGEEF
jgi:hypothetical protein